MNYKLKTATMGVTRDNCALTPDLKNEQFNRRNGLETLFGDRIGVDIAGKDNSLDQILRVAIPLLQVTV